MTDYNDDSRALMQRFNVVGPRRAEFESLRSQFFRSQF